MNAEQPLAVDYGSDEELSSAAGLTVDYGNADLNNDWETNADADLRLTPESNNDTAEAEAIINEAVENKKDARDARRLYKAVMSENMTQETFDKGLVVLEKYGDKLAGLFYLMNKKKAEILALDPTMKEIEKSWLTLAPQERVRMLTEALKFRTSWQMGIESALQIRNVKEGFRGAARMGTYLVKKDALVAEFLSPEALFFAAYGGVIETPEAELAQALNNYAKSTGLIDVFEPAVNAAGKVNGNAKTLALMMKAGKKKEALNLQSLAKVRAERIEARKVDAEIQAYHDQAASAAELDQMEAANNNKHHALAA